MNSLVILRYTGSIILIVGYFILLHIDVFWGVTLRMFANALTLPWAIQNKVWDFVILLSLFFAIELHKFLQMIVSF